MFGAEQIRSVPLWVGRDALLMDLKADLLAGRKVLALCGQGGIGKTSLAVKLLEACGVLVSAGSLAAGCAFGRVIYVGVSEGMSFDGVMAELARSLEVSLTDGLRPEQMIDFLIQGLQRSRCLVVLDNLEDVLRDGRAIDRYWGQLLWALVEREHRSQVVITSREVPKDLADPRDWSGIPNPVSVRVETIHGIDQVASVKLLKELGLRDCTADLEWVAQRVDGQVHVLTLLAKWANKPGMLRKRPDLVMQDAKPILREQLARQSNAAVDLLKRMCVLRVEIDIEGLTFLRLYQVNDQTISNKESEKTQFLTNVLVSCSLVQDRYDKSSCTDFYDLHRVIIEFLKEEFQLELPELIKTAYSFYKTRTAVDTPKTFDDLAPWLEVQHFSVQLCYYVEASERLIYKLEQYLEASGKWTLLRELCLQLIDHIAEPENILFFQRAGSYERYLGNYDKARDYYQRAIDLAQQYYKNDYVINLFGQLCGLEIYLGNYKVAEKLVLRRNELLEDQRGIAQSWGLQADIERHNGEWSNAKRLYEKCLKIEQELDCFTDQVISLSALGDCEFYFGNLDEAEILYLKSKRINQERVNHNLLLANNHYDLAKLYRAKDNPTQAQEHYAIAHQMFTQLGAEGELRMLNEEWRGGGKDEV